jgi:hypothetical protein
MATYDVNTVFLKFHIDTTLYANNDIFWLGTTHGIQYYKLQFQSDMNYAEAASNAGNYMIAINTMIQGMNDLYSILTLIRVGFSELMYLLQSFSPELDPDSVMDAWLTKANEET